MQIVLTSDVPSLGRKGDVKTVKNGYFRNFLAPRGKAIRVTPKLMTQLESQRKQMEARREKMMEKAEELAAKIEKLTLTFVRKTTAKGKLYAAVNAEQVQHDLEKHLQFELEKGTVTIEAMKEIGEYKAKAQLTDKVSAEFKVVIQSE